MKDEAFGIIRSLTETVVLMPEDGELKIELRGALAGILHLASGARTCKSPGAAASGLGLSDGAVSQVKLVAGTRFELMTFRL